MKKLALAIVALGFLAAPAVACPNSDHDDSAQAPKTAQAPKKAPQQKAPAKKAPAKKTGETSKTTTVAKK